MVDETKMIGIKESTKEMLDGIKVDGITYDCIIRSLLIDKQNKELFEKLKKGEIKNGNN